MNKLAQILILLTILLFTAGCAAQNQAQTPTSALELETPSSTPAPTATLTPVPTTTPMPTPAKALSGPGPWLVYSKSASVIFRNLLGTSFSELRPPENRNFAVLPNHLAPSGGRIAVVSYGSPADPLELLVYELPSLQIVFHTILVSEETLKTALTADYPDLVLYNLFMNIRSKEMLKWSADGHHLAYINKDKYPEQQLIIYDTQTGEQEVLLTSDQRIQIIDWSPDGENILFYTADQSEPYFSENGSSFQLSISTGLITPLGSVSRLAWTVHPLGWLNDNQLVVIDYLWEDSPRNLRIFDVSKAAETFLSSDSIGDSALDPESGTLVFDIWNLAWLEDPNTEPKEMQVISLPDNRIRDLPVSNYTEVAWQASLGLFSAESEERLILFDTSGRVTLEFPNPFLGATEIFPSPDGQYILVATEEDMSLVTLDGVVIQNYPEIFTSQILWLPDSQGFYWITSSYGGDLFLCTAKNEWQQQLIDTEISSSLLMWVNQ